MPVGCVYACVHVPVWHCFPCVSCSVTLFWWQHKPSSWGMTLGGGCAMAPGVTCLAVPQQSHRGGKVVGHVRRATSALAFCQLDAYLSSFHCSLGSRWSYVTRYVFSMTWTGWKVGQRGIWWGSTRANAGAASGEEQPHASVQAWAGPAGEQLCGEGPGRPGGRQVNHEPAVCPGCQEGQWDPGVH